MIILPGMAAVLGVPPITIMGGVYSFGCGTHELFKMTEHKDLGNASTLQKTGYIGGTIVSSLGAALGMASTIVGSFAGSCCLFDGLFGTLMHIKPSLTMISLFQNSLGGVLIGCVAIAIGIAMRHVVVKHSKSIPSVD